jgi:hypothetical protein
MANPPSVIKFAESPNRSITIKVINGVTTNVTVTTIALRTCPKKKKNTKTTRIIPWIKASRTVLMAAFTSSIRS